MVSLKRFILKTFSYDYDSPFPPLRTLIVHAVSGQNTIGIYITPLVLIQLTDVEQNAVNNNWLLKLQPAVKLQSWQKSNFSKID